MQLLKISYSCIKIYNILLMEVVFQCPHYIRNCHVEAPCCNIYYSCKVCHDQKFEYKKGCQVERMAFEKVQHIKCLNCQEIQIPAEKCSKCQIVFGHYSCLKCKLFQSSQKKKIFHCDVCKMCRIGTKQTVTHCHTCGYCVPNANTDHKCISDNALSHCPVCLQTLLYSVKPFFNLRCGHLIHVECSGLLRELNCPSCGMASEKMTEQMKQRIANEIENTKDKLPPELVDKKVNVMCNECLHKTMEAPFHFYGVKCQSCGSFNTKLI